MMDDDDDEMGKVRRGEDEGFGAHQLLLFSLRQHASTRGAQRITKEKQHIIQHIHNITGKKGDISSTRTINLR
jgi:hypothetical protein